MKPALGRLGLVMLALAGVLLALVLVINAIDEAPSPEAASYGEPRAPTIAEAENGYFALLALGAPPGADAHAWAREWIEEARAAARENRLERREQSTLARPSVCDPGERSCVDAARASPAEFAQIVAAHADLLQRYELLLAATGFEEVLDFPLRISTGFPDYAVLAQAQRAWLARSALAAATGDLEAAVAAVERDLQLQRRMTAGARTVLARAVLATQYWRDLAFLSDLLLQHGAALQPFVPRLRVALASPEFLVTGLGATVETEFAYGKALLRDPLAAPLDEFTPAPGFAERMLFRFLYKPNATINREVERLQAVAAALEMPLAQGSAALEKLARGDGEPRLWGYVDNPAGRLLLAPMSGYDEDAYQRLRMHDTLGFARLVRLQLEALAAGTAAAGVPALLAALGHACHDPYTGLAMGWDPGSGRVGFVSRAAQRRSRALANVTDGFIYVRL